VSTVVAVVDPHDGENLQMTPVDDSRAGTMLLLSCFRVEVGVLVLSMSKSSTPFATHSLSALQTSLIVGLAARSLEILGG
jgi:hypothetical protein